MEIPIYTFMWGALSADLGRNLKAAQRVIDHGAQVCQNEPWSLGTALFFRGKKVVLASGYFDKMPNRNTLGKKGFILSHG